MSLPASGVSEIALLSELRLQGRKKAYYLFKYNCASGSSCKISRYLIVISITRIKVQHDCRDSALIGPTEKTDEKATKESPLTINGSD